MTEQEAKELIESINLEQLKEYARLIVGESECMPIDGKLENLVNKTTEDVFQLAVAELNLLLAKRGVVKLAARSQTSTPKSSTLLLQIEIKAQEYTYWDEEEQKNLHDWEVEEDKTIICPVLGYSEDEYTQDWQLSPNVQCFVKEWLDFCTLILTKRKSSGAIHLYAETTGGRGPDEELDYIENIQISSVKVVDSFPVPEM